MVGVDGEGGASGWAEGRVEEEVEKGGGDGDDESEEVSVGEMGCHCESENRDV